MGHPLNLIDQIFGRLTVIKKAKSIGKNSVWLCICKCGKMVEVRGSSLTAKVTQSCGCYMIEKVKESNTIHGGWANQKPEYKNWVSMKGRCGNYNDPAYPRYGGRGIKVCVRWEHSFANFLKDMGNRPSLSHTIDRINPNGNYEPSNCRWATKKEQARNRRNTILISYKNKNMPLIEACEIYHISQNTVTTTAYRKNLTWQDAFDMVMQKRIKKTA